MNKKESFKKIRKVTKKCDDCLICGKQSSYGVHGIRGSKYYCSTHYYSEVKNVKRKNN